MLFINNVTHLVVVGVIGVVGLLCGVELFGGVVEVFAEPEPLSPELEDGVVVWVKLPVLPVELLLGGLVVLEDEVVELEAEPVPELGGVVVDGHTPCSTFKIISL